MGVYMNGIERILDHIQAEAAAERAAIDAEADARCAEITAEYTKAAQSEYEKVMSDGEIKARQRFERLSSAAALEAKKQLLGTKQEMMQAAFERAAQLLAELPDSLYIPLLARLASEASRTGSEKLAFSERDTARIGTAVKNAANDLLRRAGKEANLTVSAGAREMSGGVIVINGDIETNCSLDALIGQHRSALSGPVAQKLFG